MEYKNGKIIEKVIYTLESIFQENCDEKYNMTDLTLIQKKIANATRDLKGVIGRDY